jgi:hypothetical protein
MTSAGKALVKRIVNDMADRGLEPDAKERELLAIAEGLADQIAGLRESIGRLGYSTTLQNGRVMLNPAVAAVNNTSTALAKVLNQIQMTDAAPINLVRQRAAQSRWRAHNQAKARWAGEA